MQTKKYPAVCPHCHLAVALVGLQEGRCTSIGCGKKLPEVGKEVIQRSRQPNQLTLAFALPVTIH